jgi:hypothetical protein
VPRRPTIGSPREQRDAAVREAVLVSGKTFEEAQNVVAQEARKQPSNTGQLNRSPLVRYTADVDAHKTGGSPAPHRESSNSMGDQRQAGVSRPGRRVLKPSDLPFEDGIHTLRLRASQAARDLNLVKSGKVRITHLSMLPREMEVGGLAIDASAGASSLYQAVALSIRQSSPGRSSHDNRNPTSPTSSDQRLNVDIGALFAARRGSTSDGVIQAFELAANSAVAKSVGDKPLGLSPLKASRQAWNVLHHPTIQPVQAVKCSMEDGSAPTAKINLSGSPVSVKSPQKPVAERKSTFQHREAISTSAVISRVVKHQLEQQEPSGNLSSHTAGPQHKSTHTSPVSSTALAMATLNSRLGGTGAETAISDLVALQRDMSRLQFALATFAHLRDGGIGLDLGVLAPIPPSSMDEIKKKAAAATSAADQQQSASKIPSSSYPKSVPAPTVTLTQAKSFHLDAGAIEVTHGTTDNACGINECDETQLLSKSNSKGFSLRALRVGLARQESSLPPISATDSQCGQPRSLFGAPEGSSAINVASKALGVGSEELADARLSLHMSTPDPIPYLPYTSRYEAVAPVVWPSLSTIRQEFEADLVAKANKRKCLALRFSSLTT